MNKDASQAWLPAKTTALWNFGPGLAAAPKPSLLSKEAVDLSQGATLKLFCVRITPGRTVARLLQHHSPGKPVRTAPGQTRGGRKAEGKTETSLHCQNNTFKLEKCTGVLRLKPISTTQARHGMLPEATTILCCCQLNASIEDVFKLLESATESTSTIAAAESPSRLRTPTRHVASQPSSIPSSFPSHSAPSSTRHVV